MVHLVTGYAGYEHITSADQRAFNAAFCGSGQYVMDMGNKFAASIIDNNTVRISSGEGLMFGGHFRIETNEDVTITTGTAGVNRIDLICVTYKKNETDGTEQTYLEVIKGTAAISPTVPAYTTGNLLNGAIFNQMPLYKVTVSGVALTSVEPLFEVIPTYQKLAEQAAEEYAQAVEGLKEDVISTYTQSSSTLSGSGSNGKFKATKTGSYTSFTISGVSYAVRAGEETEIELTSGVWYSFILDASAKTINFKAGGGVSNSKLALTTAEAKDVISGKTFFSGDKTLKTGTHPEGVSGAVEIESAYTNYPANNGSDFTNTLEISSAYKSCLVFVSMLGSQTTGTYANVTATDGTLTQLHSRNHKWTDTYGYQHITNVYLLKGLTAGATVTVTGGGGGRHDMDICAVGIVD